jgi:type I restriction enzyme S subunit
MSWKKVKLGDLCTIEKGKTGIQKAISGEFPLVVTAEERKSHNEYQFDDEAVIIPLVSGTGHGHASIKRLHYQTGKFALGSILCAVIPKDKSILNAEYLFRFLNLNKERELVDRMKGMANVTLPIKEISKIEIPLPSLEEQIEFVEKYGLLETDSQDIEEELTHQLDLVKQLRQSFLREAIQGKLVKITNTTETGQQLLEKIKAEKAQLIADKKIKKEKALAPITEEEIPFEIPEHWAWCRLGEIVELKSGNQYSYPPSKNGVMYVKVGDMNLKGNEYEITTSTNYFEIEFVKSNDLIKVGSIIFPKRGGAIATNKRRAILKENILVDSNTMAAIPHEKISFKYFFHWFSTIDLSKLGNDGVIPQVNNKDLIPLMISLPPLHEQEQIVGKLEELMGFCDGLEQSIKESQGYNEMLLQQVLREALQGEDTK